MSVMVAAGEKRKHNNQTASQNATMRKSKDATDDDRFYMSHCRPFSFVFSLFRLETPKRQEHEETPTLSSIRVFAFLHFGGKET
jgi:hypothetical protein